MLEYNYTLNDPIYRYGLKTGYDTERALPEGSRIMIAGGAATQLLICDETHLLRPTSDVDFVVDRALRKDERRTWARYLSERLEADGFGNKGGLSRCGAEVRFSGLKNELSLHLDCFDRSYHRKHARKISGEFERAQLVDYQGNELRCECPMDIITNKTDRIISRNIVLGIPLSAKVSRFIDLIKRGSFDEIDPKYYMEDLDSIVEQRETNIEDLARLNAFDIQSKVQGYKVRTDVYDICCVLDSVRRKGETIDRMEFLRALRLALVNSTSS